MKKIIYPAIAVITLVSSAFMTYNPQEWKISDDYSIKFKSKDPSGIFKDFKGDIQYDANDLGNSKFDVSIDVSSISTGNGMMNKKAQTEEWFNAEKHPQIKYLSSKIDKSDKGIVLFGDLKIKGKSKPTKINVKVSESGNKATFSGTFNVDRMDFGVGKKSESVPDVLKIEFEIPVVKK